MPTPPGYARISIPFKLNTLSRTAYVVFGVDPTSTIASTVADQAFSFINASGAVKSIVDSQVTMGPATCYLGTDGTADIVGVGVLTATGGATGTAVPANVALLCLKRTARGGRRGRGRMFIPWAVVSSETDETGTINTSFLTPKTAALTAGLAALTTATAPMVLLHQPGNTPTGPPDPVTAISCSGLVATQRRRLGR